MRTDPGRVLLGAVLSMLPSVVSFSSTIPVTVLVPVVEGSDVARQAGPAGSSFPVFRVAPDSPLFARIRKVLAEEPAQASLRLDRYARNARIAEGRNLPLLINLNTAAIPELMTVPGVTLPIARQIVSARSRLVFFTAVFDLATEGILPQVVLTIASFPPIAPPLVGGRETKSAGP